VNAIGATALTLSGVCLAAGGILLVVRVASRERADPERCGKEFAAVDSRCCAPGQTVIRHHCEGHPTACPSGMHLAETKTGCVADARRIWLRGGRLSLGAEDWQSDGVQPREAQVAPFGIDGAEVTLERWAHCVRAGACRALDDIEPGEAVAGVDPREAERFCRFEGGRLPRGEEWLFAAVGPEGRRFPWGSTGLVCRRAAFGLESGPCAHGAGPELSGTRPDGATPEGLLDLVGNVAEWTAEADGTYLARGGSYRSQAVSELKGWAAYPAEGRPRDVGFRCAYDAPAEAPRGPR